MSPADKIIYAISAALVNYIPIAMGAVLFLSACFRHPKPPVAWYVRALIGGGGVLLLFFGIKQLAVSAFK